MPSYALELNIPQRPSIDLNKISLTRKSEDFTTFTSFPLLNCKKMTLIVNDFNSC